MPLYQFDEHRPIVHPSAFLADTAKLIGKVRIEDMVNIWFDVTIRGDNEWITVGPMSNVQESCVLHTDMGFPLNIGRGVTVGHQAMLHGCTIEDGALIGIQAVILNGAVIGRESLVGAGAIVTEGKIFPERSLILGAPAKVMRPLTDEEVARLQASASHYAQRGQHFRTALRRID